MFDQALFKRHLEDEEKVTMIVHKHWLIGARTLAWPVISLLFAWFLLFATMAKPILIITLIWTALSSLWFLRNFFDYYLDAWIVTDRGIIDLTWYGWFHRQSARILYSDIQGVSYEIQGMLATFLRYGTVSIEKISNGVVITLTQVPQPRHVETHILQNMETYLHSKNMKNAKHVQEILAGFIAEQVQAQTMEEKAIAETKKIEAKKKTPSPVRRKRRTRSLTLTP